MSPEEQLKILSRGCDQVYSPDELIKRIAEGRPLRVKLGMDPTAPDLTLGHTVVLRKLRQFQDLGHKAILIIGDYTSMIGDPTGRSKTRPMLTAEQVKQNAETYLAQAGKVLDLSSDDKFEIRYNGEWLAKMSFADVIKLMSQMTVARLLERDTFAERRAAGKEIFSHELLYPLMQAQDSVMIKSDVELGGTDQTFNNLCGRDLQRNAGQKPQIVMVMPILVGTDGKDKMSKSMGNYVAITDTPTDMFGKIMRVPDEAMPTYFEMLTDVSADEVATLTDSSKSDPREVKEQLAKIIITQYHSAEAAEAAADEFRRLFSKAGGPGLPDDIPEVTLRADALDQGQIVALDLAIACGFAKSRGDARRLIKGRGVKLNGETLTDAMAKVSVSAGDVVQRGKRQFAKLSVG